MECIEGPDGCGGLVEMRWPGYGHRSWARCETHGEQRVEREQTAQERYPVLVPHDFDPAYAGERWEDEA